jgi:hypothetical protein
MEVLLGIVFSVGPYRGYIWRIKTLYRVEQYELRSRQKWEVEEPPLLQVVV